MAELVHVTGETAHLPTIDAGYDPTAPAAPPGDAPLVLRLLRPAFTIRYPLGSYRVAPYGEPGASSWPLIPLAVAVLVVALVVAVKGVRRLRGR